ncbi:hypothetical protein [Aeribacillus pallidus]|uniref:hypothetical protein n=1 Tax=Aeribacillus pallidus TaxID=33936 RepID=UPI000A615FE6|nr:hypothetical protein [Aeribacillus pallidus]
MRKLDDDKKNNGERTMYFDYHPPWLERLIEESFPQLARKKYEPPYKTLWQEVKRKYYERRKKRNLFKNVSKRPKTL